MSYKHLTIEERYHIQAYKELGFAKNEIAKKLNVHPSTIGRELKRNSSKINKRYSAKKQIRFLRINGNMHHKNLI